MAVSIPCHKLAIEQTFFETSGARITIFRTNGIRQDGRWRAASIPPPAPDFCVSATFLVQAGYPVRLIARATTLARRNGTTAAAELMAHGAITADAYYRALADRLGLPWCDASDIAAILPLVSDESDRARVPGPTVQTALGILHDGSSVTISAPNPALVRTLLHLGERRMLAGRLAITTPDILRQAIDRHYGQMALEQAISGLALSDSGLSARFGALFWQGLATGVVALAAAALFAADSAVAMLSAHVFLSAFFFGCVLLRVSALADYHQGGYRKLARVNPASLPVYSVIVGLYREAPVVPDLIGALARLTWPRSKLDIILACEADDRDTIEAIEAARSPAHMRIVRVPPSMPRTKPKALNFAFAQARGNFVTIYDAEDRPHPDQLLEAYQRFAREDPRLACLQAPLVTANPGRNNLAALFHLEYAGLFGGLLPFLARHRMPMMLGGTSNHFRTEALRDAGLWDPYNVTEDADLGLRLWRKGYRCATLTRPTMEDAPHLPMVWLRQRTRWYKGWIQTWLVHTRRPGELLRQHGFWPVAVMQLLLSGTLVSALLHPVIILHAALLVTGQIAVERGDRLTTMLVLGDLAMIVASYLAFASLSWRAAGRRGQRAVAWRIVLVPVYWLALSVAAWRAVFQILHDPFGWEKTPHEPHQKR